MTVKRKMVQIHVTPYLSSIWQVKVNGRRVTKFVTQADAEACAIFLARLMLSATVKFHDRRGRIKPNGERTYPRSADPPETPG